MLMLPVVVYGHFLKLPITSLKNGLSLQKSKTQMENTRLTLEMMTQSRGVLYYYYTTKLQKGFMYYM